MIKRIIKYLIIVLLIIIASFILLSIFKPDIGFDVGNKIDKIFFSSKEYVKQTELNDRFTIVEKLINSFPDPDYSYKIYNENRKKNRELLAKIEGEEFSGINIVYNAKDLRCYFVSYYILFKTDGQKEFKGISFKELEDNIAKYQFLLPALRRALVVNREWLILVGSTLIKLNDVESIEIIKRYADGNFTDEESNINEKSNYTNDDVKEICTILLND